MTWFEAAKYCEETYGVYVSYEEGDRFFICPECDEPILEEDWDGEDLTHCPVCEFNFVTGKMEEEDEDEDYDYD